MVWAGTLVLVHSIASDDEASPVVFDRWLFSWQSAKAFDAVTELPLERLHRRSRAGDDALLRSGTDQIAWRDNYCGGFFCSCGQNEQQLRAGAVRAWQYTLMRTL
jgi:hypothetical protein